ncbi:MAG: Gldg family protein [Kiritimatiellae bacterium]|nr:Gldg family protein [Kiritimatiellia bacterium]
MRILRTEFFRTLGRLRRDAATWWAAGLFTCAAAVLFALRLHAAEGAVANPAAIWGMAVRLPLAAFAAFISRNLVGGDAAQGGTANARFDLVLTLPVPERTIIIARFLAAACCTAFALAFAMAAARIAFPVHGGGFFCTFAILLLQGAATLAAGCAASAWFARPASAALATFLAAACAPQAVHAALCEYLGAYREVVPQPAFDAHIADFAAGDVAFATLALYAAGTIYLLYFASKRLAFARLVGRGARRLRITTRIALFLGAVMAVLVAMLAEKWNFTVSCAVLEGDGAVSGRTRAILSDSLGEVRITAFLPRKSPAFAETARVLRRIENAAKTSAGVQVTVAYVDPEWDVAAATRLARAGAKGNSIVLERRNRRNSIPVSAVSESAVASAIQNLFLPAGRETVYFTTGHGEASTDDFSPLAGASTLARILHRDGYHVKPLSLQDASTVPGDAACIVSAGAATQFSFAERTWLEGYLNKGGRLLVFCDASAPGAMPLLEARGIVPGGEAVAPEMSGDGRGIVATLAPEHTITRTLAGGKAIFSRESCTFSLPVDESAGRDRAYTEALAEAATAQGTAILAAAYESGRGAARELGYSPTRIVAIGDAAFALNGILENRANANRDMVLNAIAWLAGIDAAGASSAGADTISTGYSRKAWIRATAMAGVVAPFALAAIGAFVFGRRRRQ